MKTDRWDVSLFILMPFGAGAAAPEGWGLTVGLTVGMLSLIYMRLCTLSEFLEKQDVSKKTQPAEEVN